jgi:hypothetical protein
MLILFFWRSSKMKKKMLVVSLVLAIAIVSQVNADFVEDFESYTPGPIGAPWAGTPAMSVNSGFGYGGSQGANANSPAWHVSERASLYDNTKSEFHLTLKAMISSGNGLARHQWRIGNATETLYFEMNQNGKVMEFGSPNIGWASTNYASDDVWYEFDVKLTNDAGSWSYDVQWAQIGGPWVPLTSGNLISGFAPDIVMLGGIYAWDEPAGTSSMDDVAFTSVPEPATMLLLSLGGLLLRRRR